MGVVRILTDAKGFPAVDYNFKRVKDKEAELICDKNFPKGKPSEKDIEECVKFYTKCFVNHGRISRRIGNQQFHVTISVKGNTHSKEQLKVIGEAWLGRMGYGDNPYLIFFHKNTDNNHIHIVTTRVDRQGKKVNHNFEKMRAVKALEEIMGLDRGKELNKQLEKFLVFSFENQNQLMSLFEQEGFSCKKHELNGEEFLSVYKNKFLIRQISISELDKVRIWNEQHRIPINQKQVRAVLIKYAKSVRSYEELNSILKRKMGISLAMYGKEGSFYGYNIIDFKNKSIYKGGSILGVKLLNKLVNEQVANADVESILRDVLLNNRLTNTQEINRNLRSYGYRIKDGFIVDMATGVIRIELKSEAQERIQYNDTLSRCMNKFRPVTLGECRWVAERNKLLLSDVFTFVEMNREKKRPDIDYYSSIFQSAIEDGSFKEYLVDNHIQIVNDEETLFFDQERKKIISAQCLNIEIENVLMSQNNSSRVNSTIEQETSQQEDETNITGLISSLYPTFGGSGGGSTDKKKKRKIR